MEQPSEEHQSTPTWERWSNVYRGNVEDSNITLEKIATHIWPMESVTARTTKIEELPTGQLPLELSVGNIIHRGGPAFWGTGINLFKILKKPFRPLFQVKNLQRVSTLRQLQRRWKAYQHLNLSTILNQNQRAYRAKRDLQTCGNHKVQTSIEQTGNVAMLRLSSAIADKRGREDRSIFPRINVVSELDNVYADHVICRPVVLGCWWQPRSPGHPS